ncbi:hypothetical protein GCM10027610_033440 [Dactylosporangium cerinum]
MVRVTNLIAAMAVIVVGPWLHQFARGRWRAGPTSPGSGQDGSVSDDEDTGRPVLRIAGPDDAVALMQLKQRLDDETSFMLLEPDERDTSTQTLARHLEDVRRSENSVVIVAGQPGELAGYVELAGGSSGGTGPRPTSSSASWPKRAARASAPACWRRHSAGRPPAACTGSSST